MNINCKLYNREDLMAEAVDVIDECRERTFMNISILNALMTGKAVKSKNSLLQIFEERYGSEEPLYNPDGIPAFVLCSSRHTGSTDKEGIISEDEHNYEPFVLRSYDYPQQEEGNTIYNDIEIAKSSNSLNLIEAMAATSAVPGLVGRVKVKVDDVNRSFADGFLFANSPVVVALNEARRLYPKRPLGLFMSLGFEQNDFKFASRAISVAQLSHPSLLFQRIVPVKAFADFSSQETDIAKIAVMEEKVFDYVTNDIEVNHLLDASIDKLFAPGRTKKRWQVEGEEKDAKFRKSYLKTRLSVSETANYQRRTQERSSIIPQSRAKSIRLTSFKYQDEFNDNAQGDKDEHNDNMQAKEDGNNQSKSCLCCFRSRFERNKRAPSLKDTTGMTNHTNSRSNVQSNSNGDNEARKKHVSFAHKKF